MLERIAVFSKAMTDALLGKVEDPQILLESAYNDLESALVATRRELAKALATETELKEKIETFHRINSSTSEKEEQLKQVEAEIASLLRKLEELESEVQKFHSKKQILEDRGDLSRAIFEREDILVAKAISEEGATFDSEIAPEPPNKSGNFPAWCGVIIAVLVVLIMGVLGYLYR